MDSQMVDQELKNQIIKLRIEEGRTGKSLAEEFGIAATTIYDWVRKYKQDAKKDAEKAKYLAEMEELSKLRKENARLKKENEFLKQAAAFFARDVQVDESTIL